jgi:hypothetical protein
MAVHEMQTVPTPIRISDATVTKVISRTSGAPGDGQYTDMFIFRAGWPSLSMGGIAMRAWENEETFVRKTFGVALREDAWQPHPDVYGFGPVEAVRRSLPFYPVWSGFAINTLFYAAIVWLLLAVPGTVRRWRRIKRGLCPACAYPVGDSAVCTECGRALKV